MRIITESSKTTPILADLVAIDTSAERMLMNIAPDNVYNSVLDLYDVDGVIPIIYFGSALIMSNDSITIKTGIEPNFPIIYTTEDGININYLMFTTVVVSHNRGTTNILIPGYQKAIQYTIDGTNILTAQAIVRNYNNIDYYQVNCMRLCLADDSSDSFLFTIMPPKYSYFDTTNTSVYTNVAIGANPGQNFIFDFGAFALDSNAVAYITSDDKLSIAGQVEIIGLGNSVSLIDESMLIV